MKTLGQKISELRKKQKMTQDELAEKMNVSAQAVSKWENDLSIPDITLLIELSEFFGVSLDSLLKNKESETKILKAEERKPQEQLFLKIRVDSAGGDKVKVNLPLAFVRMAVESGMTLPMLEGNEHLKGIDLNMVFSMIDSGVIGKLVEVESAGGDKVEIWVE